jgi:hypothetical protein
MAQDKWRNRLRNLGVASIFLAYFAYLVAWEPITKHLPYFLRSITAPVPGAETERVEEMGAFLKELKKDKGPRAWKEVNGGWSKFGRLIVDSPSSISEDKDFEIGTSIDPPKAGWFGCDFDDLTSQGFYGKCSGGTGGVSFKPGPQLGVCEWKARLDEFSEDRIEGERQLKPSESDPKCLAEYGDAATHFELVPLRTDRK